MDIATGAAFVLATTGAAASGVASLAAVARHRYRLTRTPDQVLRVRTEDGWTLRLLHYRPRAPVAYAEPVVLCHGLAANSFNLDLDERHSLARFLAGRGFHAIVPDLRGRHGSWPEREKWRERHGYDFDHHAFFDAPAVVHGALSAAGARRAFWVGHSMGGMVGYVEAAREAERIAGLVTLGSPSRMRIDHGMSRLVRLALTVPLDPLPQRIFAQALAPFITERFPPFPDLTAVRGNLDRSTLRYALANIVVDMPRRLLRQFAEWAWLEKPISEHGGIDYREHLVGVKAPLLVVAGNADRLAPPDDVRPAFDLATSRDRTFLVLGESDGTLPGERFGHADMVLGRHSPTTVFPLLARWLEERATRAAGRHLGMVRSAG